MAHQLGIFFPRSFFFPWQAYNRYLAYLFEKSGGSTTICTIPAFLASFERFIRFVALVFPVLALLEIRQTSLLNKPGFHPTQTRYGVGIPAELAKTIAKEFELDNP